MAAYATKTQFKDRLTSAGLSSDSTRDSVIDELLQAASDAIDDFCRRPDGFDAAANATVRYFTGSGKYYQWIDECISVSTVEVKEAETDDTYETWTSSDYIEFAGDPQQPDTNTTPYQGLLVDPTSDDYGIFTPGINTVKVTAKWGYSDSPPTPIREACLMQSMRWFKRYQTGMSDAAASTEIGGLIYVQELDPDVKQLLVNGGYRIPGAG